MWIDNKFNSPGWQGIAVRIATCVAILIAVRWLRDAVIWISENITNTHPTITDEQNNGSILLITILCFFWLALEVVYIILIALKKWRH